MRETLPRLLEEVRACTVCDGLPLGPRPVLRAGRRARVLIVGQAPGTRVHASGIPWDDPSGERLREWMGVERDAFYDENVFAIVPMGFCYPGKGRSGDLPPRPECAPLWHARLLAHLPDLRLRLLIGKYAQAHYLPDERKRPLTEVVRGWRDRPTDVLALPHPSPRNNLWLRRNPWFDKEVVPLLRRRLSRALR